ncbi:MAG: LacI family DNA-binding transcriptional regulator [Acidobacteria bacterium]|nr:LacI family DNA-binding transcriptional regulator [Acidobacteriota bacterium]
MTLDDVARRAGVSTATVSRVLNDAPSVRPATRSRVLKAVTDLNYLPNEHARTLAGGRSRVLGLLVSNIENPFFLDIYHALEDAARTLAHEVVVASTGYVPEHLASSIQHMRARRLAGIAVIVSEIDADLAGQLVHSGMPTVFYDAPRLDRMPPNIAADYRTGMHRCVEYLRGLGHRRLAFVGHHTSLYPLNARQAHFVEIVAKARPALEYRIETSDDSPEGGRLATRALLASGFRPTAIVCVNDFMAIGVVRELLDQGLGVPRDVSVTGFDNIGLSSYTSPRLTTLDIPRARIGTTMCDLLVPEAPGHTGRPTDIVITPELIVRESTGVARS